MRRPATPLFPHVVLALLLPLALLVGGCQIFPRTDSNPSNTDWDHSNLYNNRTPYARLLVEIDAVEGLGPSRDELKSLQAFLERYCDKPGGITVKVDNVIPRSVATGRTVDSLVLEFMNGASDPGTAYLYMIFYDARMRATDARSDNPSFCPVPHPIVYIDRSYHMLGNPYPGTFARAVLLHETGHALGLCASTNHHAAGGHCTNPRCRMNPSINFNPYRFLTLRNPWTNPALCSDCETELEQNKLRPASTTVDFWHGYLRRTEKDYQVMSTPGLLYLHFGEPLDAPTEDMTKARQQAVVEIARGDYSMWATVENFNPWDHLDAFARVTREKDEGLRRLAKKIFESLFRQLDDKAETEAEDVLSALSDEFIATAEEFPEEQAMLVSLREELSAPAGYGAALTRQSTKPAGSGSSEQSAK